MTTYTVRLLFDSAVPMAERRYLFDDLTRFYPLDQFEAGLDELFGYGLEDGLLILFHSLAGIEPEFAFAVLRWYLTIVKQQPDENQTEAEFIKKRIKLILRFPNGTWHAEDDMKSSPGIRASLSRHMLTVLKGLCEIFGLKDRFCLLTENDQTEIAANLLLWVEILVLDLDELNATKHLVDSQLEFIMESILTHLDDERLIEPFRKLNHTTTILWRHIGKLPEYSPKVFNEMITVHAARILSTESCSMATELEEILKPLSSSQLELFLRRYEHAWPVYGYLIAGKDYTWAIFESESKTICLGVLGIIKAMRLERFRDCQTSFACCNDLLAKMVMARLSAGLTVTDINQVIDEVYYMMRVELSGKAGNYTAEETLISYFMILRTIYVGLIFNQRGMPFPSSEYMERHRREVMYHSVLLRLLVEADKTCRMTPARWRFLYSLGEAVPLDGIANYDIDWLEASLHCRLGYPPVLRLLTPPLLDPLGYKVESFKKAVESTKRYGCYTDWPEAYEDYARPMKLMLSHLRVEEGPLFRGKWLWFAEQVVCVWNLDRRVESPRTIGMLEPETLRLLLETFLRPDEFLPYNDAYPYFPVI